MTKNWNEDGTWEIIFNSQVEAMDDCDEGIYAESDEFSEVRTETEYILRLPNFDEKGNIRSLSSDIRCTKKPKIHGSVLVYQMVNDKGQAGTVLYSLSTNIPRAVANLHRVERKVYRKRLDSEGLRYLYKYGEAVRTSVDL